jgi:hypothetical protein
MLKLDLKRTGWKIIRLRKNIRLKIHTFDLFSRSDAEARSFDPSSMLKMPFLREHRDSAREP